MSRIALGVLATILAVGAALVSAAQLEVSDAQRAQIEERIAPAGQHCMVGDSSCGGATAAASSGPRGGEEVYNAACVACHSTGAAGAPKYGDVAAWADRIAKGIDEPEPSHTKNRRPRKRFPTLAAGYRYMLEQGGS